MVRLYGTKELARICGVSQRSIQRWITSHDIAPTHYYGEKPTWLFDEEAVSDFKENGFYR
jgi:hypothetical protein